MDPASATNEKEDERLHLTVDTALSALSGMTFIVDSGASRTMVPSADSFESWQPDDRPVQVGGKRLLKSTGIGTLRVSTLDQHGNRCVLRLSNALIVPGLGYNLLSVSALCNKDIAAVFQRTGGFLQYGDTRFPFEARGNLYTMSFQPTTLDCATTAISSGDLWHRRCGHRNGADIKQLGELGLLPPRLQLPDVCDTCQVGKHKKHSFRGSLDAGVSRPLQRIYADLLGPVEDDSLNGAKYALGLVDAYSRYRFVYFS